MQKKVLLVGLVATAAAIAALVWLPVPMPSARQRPAHTASEKPPEAAPEAGSPFSALPEREAIGKPAGTLFSAQSWSVAAPQLVAKPAAIAPPSPPPMPYRVAGSVFQDNAVQIILARGDIVLTVREGDTLEGGYRVEAIRGDRVTLLYLPMNATQDLPVASTLAVDEPPPRIAASAPTARTARAVAAAASSPGGEPARLHWEGPAQVRTGTPFDVSLKVTSAEAVRSAPLQITYDPQALEAVSVRAGGFFSDGLFSYRVNSGSIFIGASGKGSVPSDAEFLVVRFMPIRATPAAELKLSSLTLQDATGRTITHQAPAVFRTVITQ